MKSEYCWFDPLNVHAQPDILTQQSLNKQLYTSNLKSPSAMTRSDVSFPSEAYKIAAHLLFATISGADIGAFIRTTSKPTLDGILEDAGQARIEYAKSGEVKYLPIMPQLNEVTDQTSNLMTEAPQYYLTSRGSHPRSINRTAIWSYDKLAIYDSFCQIDQIAPRPILLIAGSKADTLLYSENAFALAKEPKELYLVDGSTHIDLYDRHSPQVFPRVAEFFKQKL
ncbi:hypothetical protein BGZ83_004205 [Gryganskiella cystojenkinii]|nr:hypothetical protein BGZ83_004205 [Gryganskiella cystojenkinii]